MSNFVHISKHGERALDYINKRKTGELKSVLTPWSSVNNELLNGLEWNSVYMLCGNSGSGKTAISDQLLDWSFDLNPDQDFAILKLQFEMIGRSMVMRNISSALKMDLKTLSSAFNPLSDVDFAKVEDYVNNNLNTTKPIYVIDVPLTVNSIERTIDDFYQFIKKPFIVQLDHTMLVEKSTEADEWGVIRNLAKTLIKTKKKYPIIWLMLNQYNNEFEKDERQKPNQVSAYPQKKDVYGGSPGYFASDGVLALSRPSMYLPLGSHYGPRTNGLTVTNDLLVIHVLKNRVGEPNTLLLFEADFKNMCIKEA